MSQFRVQKVTKVRGLSELSSGKAGASEATKKPRSSSANSERPQLQTRQKKNPTSKTSEPKSTSDAKSTEKPAPPRPATRSKASASKKSSSKTCPSQHSKTHGEQTPGSSRGKASVEGPKLPPRPSAASKTKTASPAPPQPRERTPPKRPGIKKESSYDASCSDSDEQGSREKLSPDGDFGYETGSYDESDVSNNELVSPSARDENKNLLGSNNRTTGPDTGYSYAAVEFRPLIVQDEVLVAGPVDTRHPEQLQTQASGERLSYAYAGAEFRPLIIDDEVGIAAAVNSKKQSTEVGAPPVAERRAAPMTYEEVEVTGGEFDRANMNMVKEFDRANINMVNMNDQSDGSKYTEVYVESSKDSSRNLNDESSSSGRNIIGQDNPKDVYAEIQKPKSKKSEMNTETEPEVLSPRESKTSSSGSLYESITGELQDMIRACDRDVEGKSSRTNSSDGVGDALPPPIPRPYIGAGPVSPTSGDVPAVDQDKGDDEQAEGDTSGMPLYAAVQKKPKERPKQKEEPRPESTTEIPPPLPTRPVLDDDDTLRRGVSPPVCNGIEELPELPKRPEVPFMNKHRRKFSEGILALSSENIATEMFESSTKKGHRRCRSQDDLKSVISKDVRTKEVMRSELMGKGRSGSGGNMIQAYLEVDVTEPPRTPQELRSAMQQPWEVDEMVEYELPDGWKEVESENGTKYYWHVPSGTTQWERPQVATRPKKKSTEEQKALVHSPERQKVLSFPVHSMGWVELEESQVAPHNMSETIADCISTLAKERNDLWNTTETWGEGKDIRLLLEGDTLKLVEPRNKITLLVQPVSKMRVWGVGKEDHRDFAYVARDQQTSKHKCHMFRCHGNISGRAITNALHEMCNKILEEKKRVQEMVSRNNHPKPWSDIINTPPPPSAKEHAGFNEKPLREQKKTFTAKFLGTTEVSRPSGIDMLNKAISKVASKGGVRRTVLIEVTVSCIRITDCTSQEVIAEDRVRFLSFMGVGKDDWLCGYVMSTGPEGFMCRVLQCAPNAGTLTKALEEACQLRYQKCLDAHPEMTTKVPVQDADKAAREKDKEKEKGNFISSMQGFLGKFGTRKGVKKDDSSQTSSPLPKPTHTFMVKYYGALPVAVGTGIETVQEAAKHLTGGTLLICQLDVAINGITLYDSQRSALSRRHMDADTISYCGLTSSYSHFGLIQSQGGGKYICHVFSEYKTKAAPIVAAIQETL